MFYAVKMEGIARFWANIQKIKNIYNWIYVVSGADKNNSVSHANMYDNFWYFHSDPLINYRFSMHKWLKYKK